MRRCVGDPPRQIEDPQSPPCVPYWSGDNGGATSKGVTGDEVRVLAPLHGGAGGGLARVWQPLESFFNRRFEFYGRRLRIMPLTSCPNGNDQPTGMRAAAVCADEQLSGFASTDYGSGGGFHYFDELARRRVISSAHTANGDDAYLDSRRPYLWQYPMATNRMFATVGEWICAELAKRPASHAGDASALQTRRFGLVVQRFQEDQPVSAEPLKAELSACDERPAVETSYCSHCGGTWYDPQEGTNAVARMKLEGVTSIICLCVAFDLGNMPRAASTQGYFPEWLISTYVLNDSVPFVHLFAEHSEQLSHAFGLRFLPKAVPWPDMPVAWALRETDPTFPDPNPGFQTYDYDRFYHSLLLLASGIQLAGPRLTPQTFEQGLQRAVFPNPGHPIMPGRVGFAGGSHTMTTDAAQIWWSPAAAPGGAYCYVDGGRRQTPGSWPARADRYFQPPCDPGGANL